MMVDGTIIVKHHIKITKRIGRPMFGVRSFFMLM